jgi:flagellar basal-body rod protein FlgB
MSHDYTTQLISKALDASLMRETAIAANISNVNNRDHQTISVNFEQQLDELSRENTTDLDSITPVYEYSDAQVSIDEQMALSLKNSTQYRALIKGLNHKLAIMKLAVSGNNAS